MQAVSLSSCRNTTWGERLAVHTCVNWCRCAHQKTWVQKKAVCRAYITHVGIAKSGKRSHYPRRRAIIWLQHFDGFAKVSKKNREKHCCLYNRREADEKKKRWEIASPCWDREILLSTHAAVVSRVNFLFGKLVECVCRLQGWINWACSYIQMAPYI